MSAFMVGNTHIDALLTAGLEMGTRHGPLRWLAPDHAPEYAEETHQRGAPWGPDSIEVYNRRRRELTSETAGKVGAMLLAENAASVNHRYDESDIEEPYTYTRYARPLTPVQVLKALDCFGYQACEHPEWEESEAYKFCDALRGRMIHQLPGYEEADWEIRPPQVYNQTCPKCREKVNEYGMDQKSNKHPGNICIKPVNIDAREAIKRIRAALKARCKSLSVRMGKGTAWGWIEVSGSGEYGDFTETERAVLKSAGLQPGGNFANISPETRNWWVAKLEGTEEEFLAEKYAQAHPAFQAKVAALAKEKGKTPETMYAEWLAYTAASGDQSCLWEEFVRLYS